MAIFVLEDVGAIKTSPLPQNFIQGYLKGQFDEN